MKKILFIASAILILLSGCGKLPIWNFDRKDNRQLPGDRKGCPRDGDGHIRLICCLKVLKPLPSITLPSWQVTTVWEATSPTPTTVPPTSLCTVAI